MTEKEEVQEYVKKTLAAFADRIGSRIDRLDTKIKKLNLEFTKFKNLEKRIAALESISSESKDLAEISPHPEMQEPKLSPEIKAAIEAPLTDSPSSISPAPEYSKEIPTISNKEEKISKKKQQEKDELLKALKVIESL